MESAIEIGSLWERDGTQYMVVQVDQPNRPFTVKDADAANWQPAVGYYEIVNADPANGDKFSAIRIRSEKDFRAKFTPVA